MDYQKKQKIKRKKIIIVSVDKWLKSQTNYLSIYVFIQNTLFRTGDIWNRGRYNIQSFLNICHMLLISNREKKTKVVSVFRITEVTINKTRTELKFVFKISKLGNVHGQLKKFINMQNKGKPHTLAALTKDEP